MKIEKKTVAREFLTLLGCIILAAIFYIGTIFYNSRLSAEIDRVGKNPITSSTFNKKIENQQWIYREMSRRGDLGQSGFSDFEDLWKRLSLISATDSLVYKWNNTWDKKLIKIFNDIGIKTGEQLNQFIIDNSITQQDLNENELTRLSVQGSVHELREKKMGFRNLIQFFSVVLLIAFPLRYLYYATTWSIKTIRQKA